MQARLFPISTRLSKKSWAAILLALVLLVVTAAIAASYVRKRFVKAMRMNEIHVSLEAERTRAALKESAASLTQLATRTLQAPAPASAPVASEAVRPVQNQDTSEIRLLQAEVRQLRDRILANGALAPVAPLDRRPGIPASARPAKLRDLPYPFAKYFSIASDADGMTFTAAESIYRILNKLNLPLADSIFIEAGPAIVNRNATGTALRESSVVDLLSGDSGLENLVSRWIQQGWVDTHHGLFSGFHLNARSIDPVEVKVPAGGSAPARASFQLKPYFPFINSAAFEQAPPEVTFRYTMPYLGSTVFKLLDGQSTVIWQSQARSLPARIVPTAMSVPLDGLDIARFTKAGAITLEVDFTPFDPKGTLTIDAVGIADRSRNRVKLGLEKARELNLQLPVFSRHGMPPGGNMGVSHLHALPETNAWIDVYQGDNPRSPLYWADLLDAHGVEFVGRETSQNETVFPIVQLTYPYLFNDQKLRYSFHRLFSSTGALTAKASWEAGMGSQLSVLLPLIEKAPRGQGGIFYTHWGIPLPKDEFAAVGGDWPLSKPTLDALAQVIGRHYGVLDGKALPMSERWWIAPSHRLLVYSVVRRQIEQFAFVDEDGSTVHIAPWVDPVKNRRMPGVENPTKRLQGITVYVEKSASARAFVDGQELTSFTRNGPDESGRESITFVDNSTPTLIFDEVDLTQRPGRLVQRNARLFPSAEGAFTGTRKMDVVTQSREGFVEWEPEALSCSRADAFQFAVRKSAPGVRVGVVITDTDNQSWEFSEEGAEAFSKGRLSTFASRNDGEWQVHTTSFAHMRHPADARVFAPWGRIKSVRFHVAGEQGAAASFDNVACLRENPVEDPLGGFQVSGRLTFEDLPPQPTRVVMETSGNRFETMSDTNGVYRFAEKVSRNALVMVRAVGGPNKDGYLPDQGRLVQVTGNIADLDIKVSKSQRPPDLNGAVPAATIATGQYIQGAGNHYRPGSRFSTTGLANPTEFRTDLFLNNLGYVDREQRMTKIHRQAKRIALAGACNVWGHTESLYHNTATVMESLLRVRSKNPVEVLNMSTASQHAGVSWFFYDRLVRDYKPDVVYYELVGPLDVGLTHPQFASIFNMTKPDSLPNSTFIPDGAGGVRTQVGNPNYFNFPITDPVIIERRNKELQENAYIIDGVNFMYLFHRDPKVAPFDLREQAIMDFYLALVREVKQRFEAEGVKVVFLVTDHFGQAYVPPVVNGQPHHRKHFDERMHGICSAAKADCLHFVPWMEERFPDLTARHWRRDSHYSRIGYRWFAEAMTEHFLRME